MSMLFLIFEVHMNNMVEISQEIVISELVFIKFEPGQFMIQNSGHHNKTVMKCELLLHTIGIFCIM